MLLAPACKLAPGPMSDNLRADCLRKISVFSSPAPRLPSARSMKPLSPLRSPLSLPSTEQDSQLKEITASDYKNQIGA
jgi:hypothetical protein